MHTRVQEFKNRAENKYDFEPEIFETPESTKTAIDAAEAVGCSLDQIVKSMVFSVSDDIVLVLTSGSNRVNKEKIAQHLQTPTDDVRTANPDEVKDSLGWSIGGVPPFGHEEPPLVLLDESLTRFDQVWAGAGTPNAMFCISVNKMKDFADAKIVDIAE